VVKRFIALVLVVVILAGCGKSRESSFAQGGPGESNAESDADAESNSDAESDAESNADSGPTTNPTSTIPELTPDTTGVPSETAMSATFESSEWEITHGELNEIVEPTIEEDEFSLLVFNGAPTPGFAANVLSQLFVNEALALELSAEGAEVSEENLAAAREVLGSELESLIAPDSEVSAEDLFDDEPYLAFLAEFQARQDLFSATLVDGEESTEQSLPCARHILVETEQEADEILVELEDGGDFGEIAMERSLDPGSGANGGELGCADPANYVPEFKAAIEGAEIAEVVGPVVTEFGAHLIVVDSIETSQVPPDGQALATERLQARLDSAEIVVDPAIGSWNPEFLQIVPPS